MRTGMQKCVEFQFKSGDDSAGDGDRTTPDHAVVVTGVDTGANIVHVNDSGTPDGRNEQIPMATFSQAWRTSDDLLIVTQETGA